MPSLVSKTGREGTKGQRFVIEFTYDEMHALADACAEVCQEDLTKFFEEA